MVEQKLLFTKEEWTAKVPDVVQRMHDYIKCFCTPILKHRGEYGEAWGTGSYIQLGRRMYILTNEHVASVHNQTQLLLHQLHSQNDLFPICGDHRAFGEPLDIALLPVEASAWERGGHKSSALSVDMIALAHNPVPTELLVFLGFSGERSSFLFKTLISRGTSSTAREVPLPNDERFNERFHFGLDYRPDLATNVVGTASLPDPHGFSGSIVWNTRFVESKMNGEIWTPTLAKVTGLAWGWPSSDACIVATRSEYLRSFLLAAAV